MKPKRLSTFLSVKVVCLLILVFLAKQVIASCTTDSYSGWEIGSICESEPYPDVGAECVYVSDDSCDSTSYECLQSYDEETGEPLCAGGLCYNDPCGGGGGGGGECTWSGHCYDSNDCCGASTCWFGWCQSEW